MDEKPYLLNDAEFGMIVEALADKPYRAVANVISKLIMQQHAHNTPPPDPSEAT